MIDSDKELRDRTEGALRVVASEAFISMLVYSAGSTLSSDFKKILENRKSWESDIRAIFDINREEA